MSVAVTEKDFDPRVPVAIGWPFGTVPVQVAMQRGVRMYHDQANIARKLQPRRAGATMFMGLPAPCGTTAHGTAFDIAGKKPASDRSMRMAVLECARIAKRLNDAA